MNRQKKKGQSEIMGLAMIMIIITIGLAILVRFSLNQTKIDHLNRFNEEELALFLNNAILETNIEECNNEKVSRLMVRCVEGNAYTCQDYPDLNTGAYNSPPLANPKSACEVVKRFVNETLAATLEPYNFQYRYTTYIGNDPENNVFRIGNNPDCTGIDEDDGSTIYLNIPHPGILFYRVSGNRLMNAQLDICYE